MSVASHPALTPYRRNYTPAPAPVSIFTSPDRGPLNPADADPTRALLARADGAVTERAAVYSPLKTDSHRPDPLVATTAPPLPSPPPRRGGGVENAAGHRAAPRRNPPGQGLTLVANDPAAIQASRLRGSQQGLAVRTSRYGLAQMRPSANAAANLARGRRPRPNSAGGQALAYLRETGATLTTAELIRALGLTASRSAIGKYLSACVSQGRVGRHLGADRALRFYAIAPGAARMKDEG